jgi:hypothetical protein
VADVVSEEAAGAQPSPKPEESPFFRKKPAQDVVVNPRRFGLAYFVLAIGVGVAVGLAIVLIGRGSSHHQATGTRAFKPSDSGELGAKEIARHVGHKYRLPNGHQLVPIIGERPNYQNLPMFNYVIRPHDAQYPNDYKIVSVGNGIMYSMCGFAASCSPGAVGTEALLKREALELAYDTFKSDSAVDTVTTMLPPAGRNGFAIIFQRDDLKSVLSQPLASVLPGAGPLRPADLNADEQARVDALVAPGFFAYEAQVGPDGNPILYLDPLA